MNVMSLDIEFNQPSKKVIQVGAAAYNAKTGELLDQFETYVDPGEPISAHITEVCGIRDGDVSGAPNAQEAFEALRAFHKKHKCFKNPLVWGSGASNDSHALYSEIYPTEELQEANPNFMGRRAIDVKSIFQSVQLYHNKSISGSLLKTCEKLEMGFEGKEHTALADAKNTFRVWYFLVKEFSRIKVVPFKGYK